MTALSTLRGVNLLDVSFNWTLVHGYSACQAIAAAGPLFEWTASAATDYLCRYFVLLRQTAPWSSLCLHLELKMLVLSIRSIEAEPSPLSLDSNLREVFGGSCFSYLFSLHCMFASDDRSYLVHVMQLSLRDIISVAVKNLSVRCRSACEVNLRDLESTANG